MKDFFKKTVFYPKFAPSQGRTATARLEITRKTRKK